MASTTSNDPAVTTGDSPKKHRPNTVNYIEIAVTDLIQTKEFFSSVFGWTFVDYGPSYASFSTNDAGIDGGFYTQEKTKEGESSSSSSVLVVLYSDNLEALREKITASKLGKLHEQGIFDFPGGKRFHFFDPSGNEYAAWTE